MKSIKYKKIILLCDYGLDDAIATSYILEHHNYFDKIDIIPIAGNMPLKISFNNALRIISNFNNIKNKINVINSSVINQNEEYLNKIHGNDGIGDILPKEFRSDIKIINFNDWIKTIDKNYLIISLGPCTVTKAILDYIELPLLLMGGNISEEPNYNGYEFNQGMDKEAFKSCIQHPHVIATLDSCHNKNCDFYHININSTNLSSKFIIRYIKLSSERKEKESYIYDFITILYLFTPEKFNILTKMDRDGNKLSILEYTDKSTILE